MRVYDPRDKQWKESTNPALMIAALHIPEWLRERGDMRPDLVDGAPKVNWSAVAEMADYCDEAISDADSRPLRERVRESAQKTVRVYGEMMRNGAVITGESVRDPRKNE